MRKKFYDEKEKNILRSNCNTERELINAQRIFYSLSLVGKCDDILTIEPHEEQWERNLWAIAYCELRKRKPRAKEENFKHFFIIEENLKITRSGAVFSPQSRSLTKDFREYTKDDFSELQLIYFAACDKMNNSLSGALN